MSDKDIIHRLRLENKTLRAEIRNLRKDLSSERTMSSSDTLTSLFNLKGLNNVSKREMYRSKREGKHLSVVFIDIDLFKSINDNYGHSAGDTVLKDLSRHIERRIRITDSLARPSGDEFVLVLPNTDLSKASSLAKKIQKSITEEKFFVTSNDGKSHEISISVSIGVASTSEGYVSFPRLKSVADKRMYEEKNKRR